MGTLTADTPREQRKRRKGNRTDQVGVYKISTAEHLNVILIKIGSLLTVIDHWFIFNYCAFHKFSHRSNCNVS